MGTDSSESEDLEEGKDRKFSGERYRKSLRLSSEQLVSLCNQLLLYILTSFNKFLFLPFHNQVLFLSVSFLSLGKAQPSRGKE